MSDSPSIYGIGAEEMLPSFPDIHSDFSQNTITTQRDYAANYLHLMHHASDAIHNLQGDKRTRVSRVIFDDIWTNGILGEQLSPEELNAIFDPRSKLYTKNEEFKGKLEERIVGGIYSRNFGIGLPLSELYEDEARRVLIYMLTYGKIGGVPMRYLHEKTHQEVDQYAAVLGILEESPNFLAITESIAYRYNDFPLWRLNISNHLITAYTPQDLTEYIFSLKRVDNTLVYDFGDAKERFIEFVELIDDLQAVGYNREELAHILLYSFCYLNDIGLASVSTKYIDQRIVEINNRHHLNWDINNFRKQYRFASIERIVRTATGTAYQIRKHIDPKGDRITPISSTDGGLIISTPPTSKLE